MVASFDKGKYKRYYKIRQYGSEKANLSHCHS